MQNYGKVELKEKPLTLAVYGIQRQHHKVTDPGEPSPPPSTCLPGGAGGGFGFHWVLQSFFLQLLPSDHTYSFQDFPKKLHIFSKESGQKFQAGLFFVGFLISWLIFVFFPYISFFKPL